MKLRLPDGWTFVLRNIFRQRLRSAATLAAITLGVAGLILAGGFVQDIFVQLGEALIHSQTGHLQIPVRAIARAASALPNAISSNGPNNCSRRSSPNREPKWSSPGWHSPA